ncbi:MAG: hypothetical protein ACUZ8I_07755 [Candidatus Scalindua sp.]
MKVDYKTLSDMKQCGKSDSEIASIFGLSAKTIWTYRKHYSIKPNNRLRIDSQLLKDLSRNHSDGEIAKIFNVSGRTICTQRKFHGISSTYSPKGNRLYTIDHSFFKTIDSEEKAYTLGFITADGYVDKKMKAVTIAIQKRDTHILKAIQKAMNSNAPIRNKKKSLFGNDDLAIINLCSKSMVKDIAKYGIIPAKSLHTFYPTIPSVFDRHYIRGLMDGDGHINKRNFSLLGTSRLLDGVNKAIFMHIGHKLSSVPNNGYPRLVGYKKNNGFLSWIYKDSTIHLMRKYKIFCQFW